jgi:protein SCO1/2
MNRTLTLAVMLLAFAGSASATRSYSVQGIVLKVDQPRRTLTISCQAVPNYMEAMVMPFAVRKTEDLKNIAPGVMVDFTLFVDSDSSYIDQIHIHEYQSLEPDPLAARRLKLLSAIADPSSQATTIEIGQQVPDFTLLDQNRQPVSLSQFSGKVVAFTFMYTRCPLPNFCYRISNNFGRIQKRFADRMGRDVILLSITFDPSHDTPEALAKYGSIWKADPKSWHLLTGSQSDIETLAHALGMNYWPDEGIMSHSLHTVIVDRRGELAANLEGNEFTAEQLGDLVQSVLDREPQFAARSVPSR